jgi:hypothetical protein
VVDAMSEADQSESGAGAGCLGLFWDRLLGMFVVVHLHRGSSSFGSNNCKFVLSEIKKF